MAVWWSQCINIVVSMIHLILLSLDISDNLWLTLTWVKLLSLVAYCHWTSLYSPKWGLLHVDYLLVQPSYLTQPYYVWWCCGNKVPSGDLGMTLMWVRHLLSHCQETSFYTPRWGVLHVDHLLMSQPYLTEPYYLW